MKVYYISGVVKSGDYEESFERIVEAKSKGKAYRKLKAILNDSMGINIDNFYETTSDARL